MKEIADLPEKWNWKGLTVLATVVSIDGSAVRGRGATMALSREGEIVGSVSGGCIESAVIQAAEKLFSGGDPELIRFCPMEDEIFGSISPCGGEVEVMIYPSVSSVIQRFSELQSGGAAVLWGVSLPGEDGGPGRSFAGADSAALLFSDTAGSTGTLSSLLDSLSREELAAGVNREGWFVMYTPPPVTLCIVGGGHISISLSKIGKAMGWRVFVIDPREAYIDSARFPEADGVVSMWPEEAFPSLGVDHYCAVAALTHDDKIDDQAVAAALGAGCFYVGVLGSRKTLAQRKQRLASLSIPASLIETINGPIGLNIGAGNPEGIALATAAQIVEQLKRRSL